MKVSEIGGDGVESARVSDQIDDQIETRAKRDILGCDAV